MALNHVKVVFPVMQDEDGYPPYTTESMWCIPLGDNLYRIDNIPFFASGVSLGDVVSVMSEGAAPLVVNQIQKEGGHSTIRILLNLQSSDKRDESVRAAELRDELQQSGCEVSLSPPPLLLAVDIPPSVAFTDIARKLALGEAEELWSYEESVIASSHLCERRTSE